MSDTAIVALIAVALTCLVSICGGVWFLARLQQSIMERLTSEVNTVREVLSDAKDTLRNHIDTRVGTETQARESALRALGLEIDKIRLEVRTLEKEAATRIELREYDSRMQSVLSTLQAKMEQVWDAVTKFTYVAEQVSTITTRLENITMRLGTLRPTTPADS